MDDNAPQTTDGPGDPDREGISVEGDGPPSPDHGFEPREEVDKDDPEADDAPDADA